MPKGLTSMLMDDHGNALGAYDSLRNGIRGLRSCCEADPTAKDEIALLVYDGDGKPIDVLTWDDINVQEGD